MSRPIAYNASGPLSGSIRGGSVNYTVDSGNRDYTAFASKKWVPSADGVAPIVFVTDSYTQGITNQETAVPLFYSCNGTGSAAIIYTANRVPGSPGNYSDANVALNDLITARGYFILESNDPFEGVDADSLALDLDASKMSSYPQTGTSWFDLSGVGNNGTLTNGPTWNLNGWFDFDGTDDWVQLSSLALSTTAYTKVAWFNPDGATNNIISGGGDGQHAFWMEGSATNLSAGHNGAWSTVAYSPGIMTGRWWFGAVSFNTSTGWKLYLNGQLVDTDASTTTFTGGTAVRIAAFDNAANLFNGKIATAQVYNKVLSDTEVKQNYFGSPIVTDGLVFAVDANNIVSYPKSGTAWYGLTGSFSGSLANGPTFSPTNGGSIVFDGTDDLISTNFTQTFINELTVETWYRGTKLTRNHLWNFGSSVANNLHCNFNDSGYTLWVYWQGSGSPAIFFTSPNFTDSNIHHLVFRHSGSINQVYLDGQLLTPNVTSGTQTFTGGGVGGSYNIAGNPEFGGNVYTNRVYNRALTASEILQNYQAEQYRFETPAGPITNGLTLWLDAGNLDSYPGTGTTWYDLSGNNNNGALKSAAQWSNLGWMNYDGNNTDTETTVATVEINTNSAQGNTVEQWIYGAVLNGNGNMPFTWLDYGFDLWWYDNLFGINNGNSLVYGISGANSVLLNNWVHVVAYFPYDWSGSYTNAKLWINGVAQSISIVQGGLSNVTLPSSLNVGIGGGYTSGQDTFNWNGRISQTRIYTRELSTTEVQQNYNATKAKFGL
jgi:hypothetical protein